MIPIGWRWSPFPQSSSQTSVYTVRARIWGQCIARCACLCSIFRWYSLYLFTEGWPGWVDQPMAGLKHKKSKLIWKKAESLLLSIRQVAAAICNCMFSLGRWPPNLPFRWGLGTLTLRNVSLDPTSVPAKWHLNPSNGLSRGHEWQTDRPHYGEMCRNRRNCLQCKSDFA